MFAVPVRSPWIVFPGNIERCSRSWSPPPLLLGLLYVAETATYFAVLIAMVDRISGWMGNSRIRRRLDTCSAVVLIGFGARLALEA